MAADTDIFLEPGNLGRPLALSVALHAALTAMIILFGVILPGRNGSTWGSGGGGDAIGVSLVSTVPLPASSIQTQNVLANESKGLSKSEPQEKHEEADAIPIPDKSTKIKPKPVTSASKAKPQPQPEPETNEVPFGQGGPVSGPYGTFNANSGKGGFGFQGGGGDFGNQYGWYVQQVSQKVRQSWLTYDVDPGIRQAKRFYVIFDINRAGQPSGISIEQSSGVPSLDQSAVRAVQRIDTFGPLPSGYAGSKVTVEFYFDYDKR